MKECNECVRVCGPNKGMGGEKEIDKLPSICPKHPDAPIRHLWDQTHYILNGYPAGLGIKSNHRYECSVCGLELCSEEEYQKRLRRKSRKSNSKSSKFKFIKR